MKNVIFKIAFLLFLLYFLISCSAAKLSIDKSTSHYVSEDFSKLTITGDKFLYEEGFKEPLKYRYKYSIGHVTYKGKALILNSDTHPEIYYHLDAAQEQIAEDSLKIRIVGLENDFEKYLDIQISPILNGSIKIEIQSKQMKLKKDSSLYNLYLGAKPLGFEETHGMEARSVIIDDVLEFFSWDGDKNTVIIHIDQEKLLKYYSFFKLEGACLTIDSNEILFRNKVFKRVKS